MLNSVLRSKMEYPDMRILYDSKMRLSRPAVQREMQAYIKEIRKKYHQTTTDELLDKEKKYIPLGEAQTRGKSKRKFNVGGWYKTRIVELEKAVLQNKIIPAEFKGQWRSIEFECLFNNETAMRKFISEVRCKPWAKQIHLKTDGSVVDDSRSGVVGREISIFYKVGDEHQIRELCAVLKDKAYTNKNCGTHVHFDMRHVDERQVKLYGQRLARCVPALKTMLPSGRRNNQYCKGTINDFGVGDRYTFINLHAFSKYQTIEVRGHSGTINANKILIWIKLCETIMTSRIRSEKDEITNVDELIKIFKLDSNFAEYLKKRVEKFGDRLADAHAEDIAGLEGPVLTAEPAPAVVPAVPPPPPMAAMVPVPIVNIE